MKNQSIILKSVVLLAMLGLLALSAQANLLSHWKCDEAPGSTTLADSVGGVNGTLIMNAGAGSMDFEVSGVGASYGNALWNKHRDNEVNLGGDAWSLGTGDFTLSGWFRMDWLPVRHGNLIRGGAWDSGGFELTLLKNYGKLQFTVFGSSSNVYVVSDNVLADGEWHWFGGLVSGQTMELYVDGTLQSNSGTLYGANTTASFAGAAVIDKNMAARVDDIGLFGTALTRDVDGNGMLTSGELYQAWQNPIPEPATLALISAGFILMRRKK